MTPEESPPRAQKIRTIKSEPIKINSTTLSIKTSHTDKNPFTRDSVRSTAQSTSRNTSNRDREWETWQGASTPSNVGGHRNGKPNRHSRADSDLFPYDMSRSLSFDRQALTQQSVSRNISPITQRYNSRKQSPRRERKLPPRSPIASKKQKKRQRSRSPEAYTQPMYAAPVASFLAPPIQQQFYYPVPQPVYQYPTYQPQPQPMYYQPYQMPQMPPMQYQYQPVYPQNIMYPPNMANPHDANMMPNPASFYHQPTDMRMHTQQDQRASFERFPKQELQVTIDEREEEYVPTEEVSFEEQHVPDEHMINSGPKAKRIDEKPNMPSQTRETPRLVPPREDIQNENWSAFTGDSSKVRMMTKEKVLPTKHVKKTDQTASQASEPVDENNFPPAEEVILDFREPWAIDFAEQKSKPPRINKLEERLKNRHRSPSIPRDRKQKSKQELAEIRKQLVKQKKSPRVPKVKAAMKAEIKIEQSPPEKQPPSQLLERLSKGIKPVISKKEMKEINKRHIESFSRQKSPEPTAANKLEDIKKRRMAMKEYQKKCQDRLRSKRTI